MLGKIRNKLTIDIILLLVYKFSRNFRFVLFLGNISIGLGIAALLIGLAGLGLELQYRRRPGNQLELTAGEWNLEVYEPQRYFLVGELEFRNKTERLEIMLPEVFAEATLLSKASLAGVTTQIRVTPRHADAPPRADGYWFGYIVKLGKTTRAEVSLEIKGPDLSPLQATWIRIHYVTYGPQGRIPKVQHVIVPLKFPAVEDSHRWRPTADADLLAIKTHLLTHLDDPVAVIKRYVLPHAQPGDIVAIGETPVAIMQGRFRHPKDVRPGWLARRICYYFMPTSSLATACGMQTLIDIVGPWRVLWAFVVGAIAKKFLGKPGLFYQLAGEQARLIDDVTGTLPPYDQFIVLGPENSQAVVERIQQETGLAAAIVDANDLRVVHVLAATPDIKPGFLEAALISNPAGNADEQTPLVLIRSTETALHPQP